MSDDSRLRIPRSQWSRIVRDELGGQSERSRLRSASTSARTATRSEVHRLDRSFSSRLSIVDSNGSLESNSETEVISEGDSSKSSVSDLESIISRDSIDELMDNDKSFIDGSFVSEEEEEGERKIDYRMLKNSFPGEYNKDMIHLLTQIENRYVKEIKTGKASGYSCNVWRRIEHSKKMDHLYSYLLSNTDNALEYSFRGEGTREIVLISLNNKYVLIYRNCGTYQKLKFGLIKSVKRNELVFIIIASRKIFTPDSPTNLNIKNLKQEYVVGDYVWRWRSLCELEEFRMRPNRYELRYMGKTFKLCNLTEQRVYSELESLFEPDCGCDDYCDRACYEFGLETEIKKDSNPNVLTFSHSKNSILNYHMYMDRSTNKFLLEFSSASKLEKNVGKYKYFEKEDFYCFNVEKSNGHDGYEWKHVPKKFVGKLSKGAILFLGEEVIENINSLGDSDSYNFKVSLTLFNSTLTEERIQQIRPSNVYSNPNNRNNINWGVQDSCISKPVKGRPVEEEESCKLVSRANKKSKKIGEEEEELDGKSPCELLVALSKMNPKKKEGEEEEEEDYNQVKEERDRLRYENRVLKIQIRILDYKILFEKGKGK
jgi:hypothetical protein